jgi:hypothetical protein
MDEKISREVAVAEFDRFAEFARLEMDSFRSESAQEKMETYRQHFIENVMKGRIAVDEDGAVTCSTESEALPEVVFTRRPRQGDRKAMDTCKLTHVEEKEDAWLARVTNIAPSRLAKLEQHDIKMVKEVFYLFLDE